MFINKIHPLLKANLLTIYYHIKMNFKKLLSLIFAISIITFIACKKDEGELKVATSNIVKLTVDSIRCGGAITEDDGKDITAKGVCWSLTKNPSISNNKTNDGSGTGDYTSTIAGLQVDTVYYIRAYATTSDGTVYGNELTYSTVPGSDDKLEQMTKWMCGSFSSKNHADTTINKYIVDVRLHMCQVWDDRNVGENIYWLYVEQAYASNLESPYRQRIYKMMIDENGDLYDEVYSIPTPTTYLHGFNNPEIFDAFTEADLVIKDDCNVRFTYEGDHYAGATEGVNCYAAIPDVDYIISKSTMFPDHMTSWDLGYKTNGQWVMGPDWPYIFDKVANYPFEANK